MEVSSFHDVGSEIVGKGLSGSHHTILVREVNRDGVDGSEGEEVHEPVLGVGYGPGGHV